MTNFEKETSIWYSEDGNECRVLTYNKALLNRLDRFTTEGTDCRAVREVKIEGLLRAKEYIIPKQWVSIRKPRRVTEAQRETARRNFHGISGASNASAFQANFATGGIDNG